MAKLKTHRGAAKRFKKTGSGSYKRKRSGTRHILTKRAQKNKRQLRGLTAVGAADVDHVIQMLPNQ